VLDDAPIPSWWISACSGHGFKFGPWLGRLALELLTGRRCAIDLARFASPCR
jgi:sarcosine oxidase/sarcosine oxidase subunit beta